LALPSSFFHRPSTAGNRHRGAGAAGGALPLPRQGRPRAEVRGGQLCRAVSPEGIILELQPMPLHTSPSSAPKGRRNVARGQERRRRDDPGLRKDKKFKPRGGDGSGPGREPGGPPSPCCGACAPRPSVAPSGLGGFLVLPYPGLTPGATFRRPSGAENGRCGLGWASVPGSMPTPLRGLTSRQMVDTSPKLRSRVLRARHETSTSPGEGGGLPLPRSGGGLGRGFL
jgi:hypothetical protein